MDYIILDNTDSTNSYAALHADQLKDMTMIYAHRQDMGRGQRGNSWESAPGKNITVTLIHKPDPNLLPMDVKQFRMSEAAALAVVDTLRHFGLEAKVKWPNDVYVADRKICGILIEHAIMGSEIANSRIGIGLNVNQREFLSDAPNPISMVKALNAPDDFKLPMVLDVLADALQNRLSGSPDHHQEYLDTLWRADGKFHPFLRPEMPDVVLRAKIKNINPNGILALEYTDGTLHNFRFKEIKHVLNLEYGEITTV